LDFVDPLSLTPRRNEYVSITIEHFSKWLELVILSNYINEGVAYAFLNKAFSRFGALADVFINQGTKFCAGFQ
jgi:hypothetical protein